MDLQQINYFLGLADELHYWNAAAKMNITQSALSRQIMALESELGFALFERNRRNVRLTPAGEFLRTEWPRLLSDVHNVHRYASQIARGEAGKICIGHVGSVAHSVLPAALASIAVQYPDLKVELLEERTVNMEQALLNFRFDIGLFRGVTHHKLLSCKLLSSENYALVVSEQHPLASHKGPLDLRQLAEAPFILPSYHSDMYEQWQILESYGFTPRVAFESDFGSSILSLVARNLGITLIPISYRQGAPAGVRFIEVPHRTSLYVLWRTNDANPVLQQVLRVLDSSSGQ